MKNRVIRGSVTVIGPPSASCADQIVSTLAADPITFPNRTMLNLVPPCPAIPGDDPCRTWLYRPAGRLVPPITLAGFTPLSLDTITKRSAPPASAAPAIDLVPNRLL